MGPKHHLIHVMPSHASLGRIQWSPPRAPLMLISYFKCRTISSATSLKQGMSRSSVSVEARYTNTPFPNSLRFPSPFRERLNQRAVSVLLPKVPSFTSPGWKARLFISVCSLPIPSLTTCRSPISSCCRSCGGGGGGGGWRVRGGGGGDGARED